MWQAIVQILLIVVQGGYEWWKKRQEQAQSVLQKTKDAQAQAAQRAKLMIDGKEDELSRMDYLRNAVLYELFRERMSSKPSPQPPDGR